MKRLTVATGLLGVTIAATVLTLLFAVNPVRYDPYAIRSIDALWAGLTAAAVSVALAVMVLSSERLAVVGIALAVVARLVVFAVWGPMGYPGIADPLANVNIASNILAGDGIVLTNFEMLEPAVFRAMYPPLYPILLAGSGLLLGQSSISVFALNTAIDATAAFTIFLIGKEVLPRRAGIAAAAMYLLWPTSILLSLTAQKETTAILLALQCLLAFARLRAATTWPECVRLGVATGLLALAQPSWVPFVACLSVVLLPTIGLSRTVGIAVRSLPIFVLVMLPWWLRNYLLFDRFVPLTTSYGINLLYVATNRFDALAAYFRTAGATELGGADFGWRTAIEIIEGDPLRYLRTRFIDVIYAWGFDVFPADLLRDQGPPDRSDMRLIYWLQLSHLAVLALATVAAFRCDQRCRWPILFAIAIFAHFVIFQMWFEYSQRHRYLLMPVLFLLIAQGLRRHSLDDREVEHKAVSSRSSVNVANAYPA